MKSRPFFVEVAVYIESKKSAADISIVMSVYNHEDTISEAIDSVLAQQGDLTVVLFCLNDASTDKSAEIIERYRKNNPEVIKVFTSSVNLGSGKKQFYTHRPPVDNKYWCFLAGDDYWLDDNKLIKQFSYLENNLETVGCSCNTLLKNEVNHSDSIIKPSINEWDVFDIFCQVKPPSFYVHTSSILWRNNQLKHGFFLPPAFEKEGVRGDVMLGFLMIEDGGLMHNLPETMSCYRYTGKGVWSSLTKVEQNAFNSNVLENTRKLFKLKTRLKLHFYTLAKRYRPLSKLFGRLQKNSV